MPPAASPYNWTQVAEGAEDGMVGRMSRGALSYAYGLRATS